MCEDAELRQRIIEIQQEIENSRIPKSRELSRKRSANIRRYALHQMWDVVIVVCASYAKVPWIIRFISALCWINKLVIMGLVVQDFLKLILGLVVQDFLKFVWVGVKWQSVVSQIDHD